MLRVVVVVIQPLMGPANRSSPTYPYMVASAWNAGFMSLTLSGYCPVNIVLNGLFNHFPVACVSGNVAHGFNSYRVN